MPKPIIGEIEIGSRLPTARFYVTREGVVRYASATKDFNPIHWDRTAARGCGLEDTISHGMLIFAQVLRVVAGWVHDPTAVVAYELSFENPLVVIDDTVGALVEVQAIVTEELPHRQIKLKATATCDGKQLIRNANVVVQL